MNLQEAILKEELEFPKLFASIEEKEYGILFFNEDDRNSHDSNHAILYPDRIIDFEQVILDIKAFYLKRNLIPRIYQPFTDGYFSDREAVLTKNKYHVEIFGKSKFMLLSAENTIHVQRRLDIRRITKWNEQIASDVYLPSGEDYAVEVEKNSLKNNCYYLFAGYLGREIAALVSFHKSEHPCTRFDYIETAPKFRGNGYARELLSYTADYCRKNNLLNCFQWPAHKTSEKICYEAGFRTLFEAGTGEAVYLP
jgi:hypothetical protein